MIDKFSPEVIEQLGYYVYRLIDPRNGETFYIGKGYGNRLFDHIKGLNTYAQDAYQDDTGESIEEDLSDPVSDKMAQLSEIKSAGLDVIYVIQRYGLEENEAIEVEAALIDCFPGITNVQRGYAAERGVNNAAVIEKNLSAQSFDDDNDLSYCIIKIRQETINQRGSIYEAVRKSWKVKVERINTVTYVIAVCNNIVKDVFKVNGSWYEDKDNLGRYMFDGEKAPDDICSRFIGKSVPEKYRRKGMANPIQYKKY